MQLPTGTTATAGAQDAPSTASTGSIFKISGGSAAGKKSLLPTFATVLAEQAGGKDADEQVSHEIGRQIGQGTGKGVDQQSDNGTHAADGLERGEAAMLAEESALGAVDARVAYGGLHPFAHLLPSDVKNAAVKSGSVERTEQTTSSASHKSATRSESEGRSASSVSEKKPGASSSASIAASIFTPIPVAVPAAAVQQMPIEKRQTVQKSGAEPGVPASVNMHLKTAPNAGVSAALDSTNGKEGFSAHTMADPAMEAAAASKPESQGATATKEIHATEALGPASANSGSASLGAQSASAQQIASQLRSSSSDVKTPFLSQAVEGASAAAQAAAKTAGQVTGVQAAAAKSKLQQKGGGNAAASAVSSSANFAATVSPRSNPAASGAEFAVRANDAVNSGTDKTSAASDESLFQRLDSGEAPATLLHSSAHQIAVGVHDPSLGWVEVQTQSAAGHISATLTAASTDAHANLTAQMPAMTQYLADRNVSLHSLNVDTQGSAPGGGQPQHFGSGSESGQPQQEAVRQSGAVSQGGTRSSTSAAQDSSATGTVGASHISVRA